VTLTAVPFLPFVGLMLISPKEGGSFTQPTITNVVFDPVALCGSTAVKVMLCWPHQSGSEDILMNLVILLILTVKLAILPGTLQFNLETLLSRSRT